MNDLLITSHLHNIRMATVEVLSHLHNIRTITVEVMIHLPRDQQPEVLTLQVFQIFGTSSDEAIRSALNLPIGKT